LLGECGGAVKEHASTVAWLRHFVCGDAKAKSYFYGDDCALCTSPWAAAQRKNWK
jgi:hypothetical protein